MPLAKRRWGYYVLPVLYGDKLVARADVWARNGVLEIRNWHWENGEPAEPAFWDAFEVGLARFLRYLGANEAVAPDGADSLLRDALNAVSVG